MQPENFRFGGGAGQTLLHPLVLAALLVTVLLIFLLPRRYLVMPLLACTFLIPLPQELLIGGVHFFVFRLLVIAFAVRMLIVFFSSPDRIFHGRLDRFDLLFLCWAILRAAAVILIFRVGGAVINQAGFLMDAVGGFFLLRYAISDDEDITRALKSLAVISFVISLFMLWEKTHQTNLFAILGGVPPEPEVRDALVRAQGPFQHEILAGTFGATLAPLFFMLWKTGKSTLFAVLGFVAATIITFASGSSTPVFAFLAGLAAICLWPMRRHMRLVRWGVVAGIAALSAVMKAPVWFLIARVGVVGGSSGYHRAMLVNNFVTRFSDWWLIGTKENSTWGANMWDLSNQFVAEGQTGGLATFICFMAVICIAFSRLGRARKAVEGDRQKEWYFWSIGCALFAHISAFMGISYFDQVRVLWFLTLVIAVVAAAPYLRAGVRIPATRRWTPAGIVPIRRPPSWPAPLGPSGNP
jgi:hypothetical protein